MPGEVAQPLEPKNKKDSLDSGGGVDIIPKTQTAR